MLYWGNACNQDILSVPGKVFRKEEDRGHGEKREPMKR
jgi:hypothetical protein